MKHFLKLSVFICGMATMAIEMTASRMIGNVFSAANLVWAGIIGSILLFLAAGNWLGGKVSSRFKDNKTLFLIILIAGISCSLIPVAARPLLNLSSKAMDQLQFSSILLFFILILLLLFIPMTNLGMITPLALSLSKKDPGSEASNDNNESGKILALSTIGSFFGTFLPVFFLIPQFGSNRSFFLIGFILILTAGIGLFFENKSFGFLLFLILLLPLLLYLFFPKSIKSSNGQLYEKESAYNYIEVMQDSGFTMLKLNDGQAIQSIYKADVDNYYGPWEQILTAPFLSRCPVSPAEIEHGAVLGAAGGTSVRQLLKVFPNIQVDGFEIDPEITSAAAAYFDLPTENYTVRHIDGRIGLQNSSKLYDVIMVDAYHPPYIAANMSTVEFFKIAARRLKPDGVLMMNIGRSENDRRLLNAITATVSQVFPEMMVVDIPNAYNSILFAQNTRNSLDNLRCNYEQLSSDSETPILLLETLSAALGNHKPVETDSAMIFTDDSAPVEIMTNQTIFGAFFSQDKKEEN